MAVGAGDRGPRGQNVRPGAGDGAVFGADGDGDEVAVPEVPDRGDAPMQRLPGMLTRPLQQDGIRGVARASGGPCGSQTRWVCASTKPGMRVTSPRSTHAARGGGGGEIDVGDPAVVHQHEDRALVEPFAVKETRAAYR